MVLYQIKSTHAVQYFKGSIILYKFSLVLFPPSSVKLSVRRIVEVSVSAKLEHSAPAEAYIC